MFFRQILSNTKKNRKDNGLFFATLIIAIVAFYTLLSLESQDVMRFLNTIESNAVRKLMLLVPLIYVVSLFFVFFLVYFAYSYQMENRRREFGLYLMLGMKRFRLFLMLICETILNSMLSILAGIPIALLLTESISLATARLVGLGIIGHRLTISLAAVLGTIGGFFLVQLAAMLILSFRFCRMEPAALLRPETETVQHVISKKRGILAFFGGAICLIAAYITGIGLLHTFYFVWALLILVCGTIGTFLLYRGLGAFIGQIVQKRKAAKTGLYTFTGRQIQESVLHQHTSLAVSSLLLLLALACISFGIGMGFGRSGNEVRVSDFSLMGSDKDLETFLTKKDVREMIDVYYPMYLNHLSLDTESSDTDISLSGITAALETVPQSDMRDNIIENIRQKDEWNDVYFISLSSYNALLDSIGEEEIILSEHQVAFFTGMTATQEYMDIWNAALNAGAYVEQITPDGVTTKFDVLPELYYNNIVADRAITLYCALIVPDSLYREWSAFSTGETLDGTAAPDETTINPAESGETATADETAAAGESATGGETVAADRTATAADFGNETTLSDLTPFCWNIRLSENLIKDQGLLPSVLQMDETLAASGLSYDSYLGGIGRTLFYTVASSYLSIYLGVLFLLIANTVLVLKYLIWQKKNRRRYLTLLMLGAERNEISRSMESQIRLYFLLVLSVAVCSSVFAIWSMFTSFMRLPAGVSTQAVIALTAAAFICFIIVELIYIHIVQRKSRREIQSLHITERTAD